MIYNDVLRDMSRMLYSTNGVYTNTIDYMVAMPTLDKVLVPFGKNKKKKQENMKIFEDILKTIRHKETIRDFLFNGMIDGTAISYFETKKMPTIKKNLNDFEIDSIYELNNLDTVSGINASIISLPIDYCKIIGYTNNIPQVAFNLDYFTDNTNETEAMKLSKVPEEIRIAYNQKKNSQGNSNWVRLDCKRTIVHKIKSSRKEIWGRPLVLSAIRDILYSDYFTQTKRNVLDEINNRIVYETFPEGKEKGTSALTQKQQREQHTAIKDAVITKNNRGGISFFSVAAGTKIDKIELGNTDIFDEKNEKNLNDTISLDLGIAASLLNGSGSGNYQSQQNNLDLISSQIFQWIEQIQNELNKVINFNIIKDPKNRIEVHYLPITHVNKDKMVGYARELYLQGKGSISLWASAVGISSEAFFALIDKELEDGVEDKYPVHKTSNTLSAKDQENKGGRPKVNNPTNPNTIQSQLTNSNNVPKPSTN